MDVILDTSALSAWLDGDPLFQKVLRKVHTLLLSPIVLGEYRFGIGASRYRSSYEKVLAELLEDIQVLPLNDQTSRAYAEIRRDLKTRGTPIPWHDIWIAAQARCFHLPILSRDGHFDVVSHIERISW